MRCKLCGRSWLLVTLYVLLAVLLSLVWLTTAVKPAWLAVLLALDGVVDHLALCRHSIADDISGWRGARHA